MPGIDGQRPRLADILECAAITAQKFRKLGIQRNQIFILLRWTFWGYWMDPMGAIASGLMGLLLFGIGNVVLGSYL